MAEKDRSKREIIKSKVLQRQIDDLQRDAEMVRRRGGDREIESDDSDDGIARRNAKKWWRRFQEMHFSNVSLQDCRDAKTYVSSNQMLQQCPKQTLGLSYAQEQVIPSYDLFADHQLIHVLYKATHPQVYCLASYQLNQAIPNYADKNHQENNIGNFRITPSLPGSEVDATQLRAVKLSLAGICHQQQVCKMVEKYKKNLYDLREQTEVDRQICLWQQELEQSHTNNRSNWQRLYSSIKKEVVNSQKLAFQTQISCIKQYLRWVTVLKYFEHGFAEKTMQMLNALIQAQKLLKPSKSKETFSKKFFQTDCKICFCSLNNDSNQVLYCDSCNTSFHLACYGLQQIPKQQIYFCDCCRFSKTKNVKKPICQLCFKSNFPIKEIQGHFYHVTCLLLLNLARLKGNDLVLRQGITHSKIMETVVQNQLTQDGCQFCSTSFGAQAGIRLRCSFKGCRRTAHPICAYINGCKFSVKKDSLNEKLCVGFYCNFHNSQRDWMQQMYLRRYMCNLKDTSKLSLSNFTISISQELQKRNGNMKIVKSIGIKEIISKTKLVKRMMEKPENKPSSNVSTVTTEISRMKYNKK